MEVIIAIKTTSLSFDERLVKEIGTLRSINDININLFIAEDQPSSGEIDGVTIHRINSRIDKLGLWGSKIFVLCSLGLAILKHKIDKRRGMIWLHDPITMFFLPICYLKTKRIIWDLHEMPPNVFLHFGIFKQVFRFLCMIPKNIVVANHERGEVLRELGLISKFTVIENYPSVDQTFDENFSDPEFDKWAKDKSFAYCQSATHPSRNFYALAESCVRAGQFLMVVGEKNHVYDQVRQKLPDFDKYINVIGKRPSKLLPYYFKNAKFSFVFYSDENLNNFYCAPNRLYHSLNFGIPVIVGSNPPMKKIVESQHCGIVLKSFGDSISDNINGIKAMNQNYHEIKRNAERVAGSFVWQSQDAIIKGVLNTH